ncbi:hypothetical protein WJX72_003103 [[Myrmecia] bisecta]|uniref:Uncharacterized protein n=1 Tax=[Myrmecia] bisecta TaxID=41462 RepID=A0AAW1QEL6_9CHLO
MVPLIALVIRSAAIAVGGRGDQQGNHKSVQAPSRMDHLPDRQQQADLHAEMERVSSNMVDALLEGTPRKGHTTAQQQIAQQQAQQHQAGPEAAEALQQHADAGPTAAYHLQGTDFANLGPPAQAYADVAARLEPPMQPAASNASSISISSKGKPPEPAGQLTAAQAEKLRKEVARLTAETERLEKEVQRQKTLRETERIEFLEAKEKLKHGWATDRDDFARVKDQLKKKNAEHHLQNGRLSQSLKESEAIARSLREVCQRHNIPIPPHLREGVPAQSTSRPGSPVRGTSGEQAATQLGLEDALQAQMQLSGHGTAGPGLLPPATAVGVPATLAQQD